MTLVLNRAYSEFTLQGSGQALAQSKRLLEENLRIVRRFTFNDHGKLRFSPPEHYLIARDMISAALRLNELSGPQQRSFNAMVAQCNIPAIDAPDERWSQGWSSLTEAALKLKDFFVGVTVSSVLGCSESRTLSP